MNAKKVDVIVVGSGPGGAVAAKKSAENGFKTLLLEKRKLPRYKVCSGMIMGPWADTIIQDDFGDIPKEILTDPYVLSGHKIHVTGSPVQTIECQTPVGWRKDLDFWMAQRSADAGVEILDCTRVVRVSQQGSACTVWIKHKGREFAFESNFVIAADGGASAVRKSLFPDLKVAYSAPIRECYLGSIEIEKDFIHWFFPKVRPRPRFDLLHKDQYFVIEGSGIRVLRKQIQKFFSDHGVDPMQKPEYRDGCLMPLLHDALITGTFVPAKKNVLLVGDAAGLVFPITFEGIGSALKSGILAAEAVARAADSKNDADVFYLEALAPVITIISNLLTVQKELGPAADQGAAILSARIKHAYEATLKIGANRSTPKSRL